MTITYPYWNNGEVISSDKLNSMVQAIINGDPLAVKVSNATKNDVNQIVGYLSSLHDKAKDGLNSATYTGDFDTAYTNMTDLVSNKLGAYANDDTVDLYSTGIRASIIAFLQAYDNVMSHDRQGNKNIDYTLGRRIDSEAIDRENADSAIDTTINAMKANGGGRNLLRYSTNDNGKFQPNLSRIDNYIIYAASTAYMRQGQQYTVHANASEGLVWSDTHNPKVESNNVVLWLTDKKDVSQIISDANTGTKTTFTWDNPSGTYYLRVNTYKTDNSGYVEKVMLEKGTVAHDWSPAPEDTDAKITDLDNKTMQNRGTVNAPDFNSLTQAGYYTITDPIHGKNYPATSWGTLDVSGQVDDVNGRLNQKYVSDVGGTIYTRQYNAGTKVWTSWVQMANTNDVDAKINRLQIGGINLLKDTDKMTNTNYWGFRGGQSVQAFYAGKRANEMGISLSDHNVQFNTSTSFIDYIPQITLEQGTDYTVSFWTTFVNKPLLYLNTDDGYNHQHWGSSQTISLQASGREYSMWKQVTATFQPTVATTYLTFGISTDSNNTVSAYWVSSFKLEKGNKVTDFSPAPEDADNYASGSIITFPNNSSITLKNDRIIPHINLPVYLTDNLWNTDLNNLATSGEYDSAFIPSATMATLTNRPTNPDTNAPLTGDCFYTCHYAYSGNTVRAFQKIYSCDYNYVFIRSYSSSSGWSNWSCLTPYA